MVSWKLKTSGRQPVGLDIGYSSIKAVQLAINGEHISVLAADKVRINPSINGDESERRGFVVSAVKQMLAEGGFHGRNVITCLPNEKLKMTSLRLAETENREIEQVLRKEAAQRFGLDPDGDVINYMVAGSIQQDDEIRNELILFAADNETIKTHIEMLEEAGLRPVGIDVVPCALFRGFERSLRRQEDRERTVVFVDVGSRFTTVVFGRGGGISFVKQIPIGGEKFNRQIAAELGISVDETEMLRGKMRTKRMTSAERGAALDGQQSDRNSTLDASTQQVIVDVIGGIAEELAREISLCFRYYTVTFRGKRVERAVLAGGEAYENILLNVLRRQLAVEIEVAQPFRGFSMMHVDFDGCKRGLLCEWAVAVGLGLKNINRISNEV
jgi:type IV pilus assembly protein PilM